MSTATRTVDARGRSGFAHLDRARSMVVETPEHVGIGFELAGIGSRAAAMILDVVLVTLVVAVVFMISAAAGFLSGSLWIRNIGLTAATLAAFVAQWGYFFLSEGFFSGRTIGKRWLGLRVIGQGGAPITLQAAALRNLLRIIDIQPAGSSLVGLGLIALHPKSQRLGDIVAGTVVVRDRGDDEIPEQAPAEEMTERPYLDPQRFDVLERYIQRRDTLPREVRTRLAGRVASAMGRVVAEHPARHTKTLDELLVELYDSERPRQTLRPGVSVQAVHLVRSQRPRWLRLRELVDRATRRGLASLSEPEIEEFTTLYREVVADLARAHTYGGSLRLCFHLERLAGEAHNLFYRGTRTAHSPVEWLRVGFPSTLRAHRSLAAIAALLLFLPSFITYAGVVRDPSLGRALAPVHMITRAEEAGERLRRGEQYVDIPPVQMSLFSSSIMTNNLQVAFTAAAGGIVAGLGTVTVLLFNGIHLGAVFALYALEGAGLLLWIWVLPHGVLEMTAIVVAATAGLRIGLAIVTPGRRTRARALVEDGRAALSLLAGAAVLLVLAGLVEGFVSPAETPYAFKFVFASGVAVLLALYLGLSGRGVEGGGQLGSTTSGNGVAS